MSAEEGDALSKSTKSLLQDLNLLEPDAKDPSHWWNTDPDYQLIKAGATSLTKWWVGLAGALGLGSASAISAAWKAASGDVQVALVAGGSAVIAAALIAIAILVYGDVRARAQTTSAHYAARSMVAATILQSASGQAATQQSPKVAAIGDEIRRALQTMVSVVGIHGSSFDTTPIPVLGIKRESPGNWRVKTGTDNWESLRDVESLTVDWAPKKPETGA